MARIPESTFVPGEWNAICDRCAGKFKSSQLRKTWNGLMVCRKDWEPRPAQDFVRAPPDTVLTPWTSPPPDTPVCMSPTSRAGEAVAGCAITSMPVY